MLQLQDGGGGGGSVDEMKQALEEKQNLAEDLLEQLEFSKMIQVRSSCSLVLWVVALTAPLIPALTVQLGAQD